ncbi:MAG TPA: NAD(P)/FAD-dependent oxidoreductase [Chthoniobacterales bacterium]|nr:NAD(P)/FAD-dependent oxidoreductase [Chthoniobacterales bacterium]
MQSFDVIVIGGGAAGLMCALTAGRRGRRVALLEHNARVGLKIAISGGGRCNFTNLFAEAENYLSARPRFCASALARYTPNDFIALVEKHRIAFHEKKLGQLFCDRSSREIIEMLLAECAIAELDLKCGCCVESVAKRERFSLGTNRGEMECDSLVIATGGLSFPKLGASDFGYRVAEQFGLKLTDTRPGLVPFVLGAEAHFPELSGVSLPVVARANGASFAEAMLLTHRGLSGPAILQVSSFWREGEAVEIDLLPQRPGDDWLFAQRDSKATAQELLAREWPARFAAVWCERYAPAKPLAQAPTAQLEDLARLVHHWPISPNDTEGYPKAEVTVGGVETSELSSKTMEARRVPGLFFIGEVVDVTGWLGGYNFQWAWASGHAAGEVA